MTNGGTAIQYTQLASMSSHHAANTPRMMLSVLTPRHEVPNSDKGDGDLDIPMPVLERHPFTSQTFIPLSTEGAKRFIVVAAPSLESWDVEGTSVKVTYPSGSEQKRQKGAESPLPHAGGPDLSRVQAFLVNMDQGVTYGPGTWHSPMVALGPEGSTVDFVVVQFANDVDVDDLQQVKIQGAEGKGGLSVCVKA